LIDKAVLGRSLNLQIAVVLLMIAVEIASLLAENEFYRTLVANQQIHNAPA
jgi:hypothetical protein